MLALGCDHGGYNLICAIKKYLDEKGIEYKDFGILVFFLYLSEDFLEFFPNL